MFIDKQKTKQMLAFLETEHFRYTRDPKARPQPGEMTIDRGFELVLDGQSTPLVRRMEQDFRFFLKKCLQVNLQTGRQSGKQIIFHLAGTPVSNTGYSRDESFDLNISDKKVIISAPAERGLLHGAHFLERKMALRGGPFLPTGIIRKKPVFNPRLSITVFGMAQEDISYPLMYTDKYLSLMSHFGVNGILIYIIIWDYSKNKALPGLNSPRFQANISKLRAFCQRLQKFGIDVYPLVNTHIFDQDAAVFKKYPQTRGAPVNLPLEFGRKYNLCSSNARVLAAYNETMRNIFLEIPELGGAVFIIGGECFFHCFTRPKPPLKGGTSCPHCNGRNPSIDVANLMNGMASAVHSSSREAKVFCWPYSAFTWSGEKDFAQVEMIRHLSADVELLSTFETPYRHTVKGVTAVQVDYNIINIGPSLQFATQSKALAVQGKLHYAKFESSTEPSLFHLPYIPVHTRWHERYRSLIRNKVPGFIAKWRFYGFTGSWTEEMLSELTWAPGLSAEKFLTDAARRDFGKYSPAMISAWKKMGAAWGKIPLSHLVFGDRQFYMKGPFYLGPAHPLIFDVQNRYNLAKDFFTVRGDAGEMLSKTELAELEKNAPPRYSSDMIVTYPFGPQKFVAAMQECIVLWQAGVGLLKRALGNNLTQRAELELNICRNVLAHMQSARNVIRFYTIRDAFFNSPGNERTLSDAFAKMAAVIREEISNAEAILPVVEKDFRLGYGHYYGQVYDADMIRDKIRQCRFVLEQELPLLKTNIMFHISGKYTVR